MCRMEKGRRPWLHPLHERPRLGKGVKITLSDGQQIEDRRQHCSSHIEIIQTLGKIELDGAVTRSEVAALSRRINGAMDKIHEHMETGAKFRLAVVGISITVVMAALSGIFGYGLLTGRVDESHRNIAKIERMIENVLGKIDSLHERGEK